MLRRIALLVAERDTQLDDLEHVDITSHGLEVVIRAGLEAAYRSRDDSREFGVLRVVNTVKRRKHKPLKRKGTGRPLGGELRTRCRDCRPIPEKTGQPVAGGSRAGLAS